MKIYIGPYKNWLGPQQLAENILFWKDKHAFDTTNVAEEHPDRIAINNLADFLDKIPGLTSLCTWINNRKQRKIDICIDSYDVWSADHTLALIIVPLLKKVKEQKRGAPLVDDRDVPDHLKSTAAPALTEEQKNTGHTDALWCDRWNWVLGEMIWAFEQHANPEWDEQYISGEADWVLDKVESDGYTELKRGPKHTLKVDHRSIQSHRKRMENGRRLFAKYYESLWD